MKNILRLVSAVLLPLLFLSACSGKNKTEGPGSSAAKSASTPAAVAPFEGILYMTTTVSGRPSSQMKLFIGKEGVRTESTTNVEGAKGKMSMTTISPTATPNLVYMINNASGTCMEIDISKAANQANETAFNDAKIENLGNETVNGYNCKHIRITEPGRSEVMEMWVSPDIIDYATYARMQASRDRSMSKLEEKLKAAGAEGFPVRMKLTPSGVVTELTKVERTTPDASLFKAPANCTKMELPTAGPKGYSKEDIRKLQEMGKQMQQK
jgi:hypothetical protein